ncbi:MAG: Tellurium resistance protein TerA [Alphaproteobacteria bacterium]|nr:Tellurium resistance protein TerA [Alphaproteobacteria bacterium]
MKKKTDEKISNPSNNSMVAATKSRANFSGHGGALGASGYRVAANNPDNCEFLNQPGQSISITPSKGSISDAFNFQDFLIGVEWDNVVVEEAGFFGKIFKKVKKQGVDLDIGCLYEMKDGTRGAIQAFGDKFGDFDNAPYIFLSGDERTGDSDGHDEFLLVNGKHWDKIKRLLIYIYIYEGAATWSKINPQIILDVPGEDDLVVTLGAHNDHLCLCAVGGLENIRGGIKLTNYTEYFPGHAEMDRAFGFGLDWADGKKG